MSNSARTLADIQRSISERLELGNRQRSQVVSAINTFCKVVGCRPELIPESVIAVRDLMASANPGHAGIQRSTWRNVKSKVMLALRLTGHPVMSGRCKTPCSPAWRSLLDRLPPKPHRLQLTPLTRWCCENQIEPEDFDQERSELFRQDMERRHPKKSRHKIYLRAVKMWNSCRKEFPEFWPPTSIAPRFNFDRYSFAWSEMSPSFRADTEAMLAEATKPPLRRRAAYKGIKPSTAKQRRYTALRVASAICRARGLDPSAIRTLGDICDPLALEDALDFLETRSGQRTSGGLHLITRIIHTIAKYWVGAGEEQLRQLAAIRGAVKPHEGPSDRNIALLTHFRDRRLQEEFLLMPERVFKRLAKKNLSRHDCVTAQLAFAAGLLVCAPMRSHNLAGPPRGRASHRNRQRKIAGYQNCRTGGASEEWTAVELPAPQRPGSSPRHLPQALSPSVAR
jgi:hypothetical protein